VKEIKKKGRKLRKKGQIHDTYENSLTTSKSVVKEKRSPALRMPRNRAGENRSIFCLWDKSKERDKNAGSNFRNSQPIGAGESTIVGVR